MEARRRLRQLRYDCYDDKNHPEVSSGNTRIPPPKTKPHYKLYSKHAGAMEIVEIAKRDHPYPLRIPPRLDHSYTSKPGTSSQF